jgi:hypothetical protein
VTQIAHTHWFASLFAEEPIEISKLCDYFGRNSVPIRIAAGAWAPDQTVDFMLTSLEAGDFYILCPDNDVDRETDEQRILRAAGDIVENRPPLSRWRPDYADRFAAFLKTR